MASSTQAEPAVVGAQGLLLVGGTVMLLVTATFNVVYNTWFAL